MKLAIYILLGILMSHDVMPAEVRHG